VPPAEPANPAELERRPSDIAGAGVFATADLPAGTAIAGGLNHSCDPNTWFDGEVLVTRRAVAAGEELTYDYATGPADWNGRALFCHCETYRCRQVVEPEDWRIPQLQQRYAGHFAPSVQQLIDASP
jgi:hypothetical protein